MKERLVVRGLNNVVRKVDKKLSEATLCRGVVSQDRGEGGIAERFRKALAEGLTSASVVTQACKRSVTIPQHPANRLTEGNSGPHA